MIGGMKVKTSVTLSEELLEKLQARIGARGNRSEFIEEAVQIRLRDLRRAERGARDAAIYASLTPEQFADSDVLDFSIDPMELGDDVEVSDEVLVRWAREDAARGKG